MLTSILFLVLCFYKQYYYYKLEKRNNYYYYFLNPLTQCLHTGRKRCLCPLLMYVWYQPYDSCSFLSVALIIEFCLRTYKLNIKPQVLYICCANITNLLRAKSIAWSRNMLGIIIKSPENIKYCILWALPQLHCTVAGLL